MGKELYYDLDAKEKLKEGVVELSRAVKDTLGARGRAVLIDRGQYQSPIVTKDGVTVAKEIDFDEPIKNMGARLIKDVANKTNDEAGDGTTTATVLAESLFVNGIKMLAVGVHPVLMKRGMDKACKLAVELLKAETEEIGENIERVKQIALISANGDEEVSNIVSEAIKVVHSNGVITIEEGNDVKTVLDVVKGMQFEKGYQSPYFVTDVNKLETVYEKPFILLTSQKINNLQSIIHILEYAASKQRPIVIIADAFEPDAISGLVLNKVKGGLPVVAIQSPSYGEMRVDMMEDLSALTGARYFSDKKDMVINGSVLDDCKELDLGTIDKIIVTKNKTIMVSSKEGNDALKQRLNALKQQIKDSNNDFDKEKLRERLAKLDGGVAVIYVGGNSEVELKEKKDRFEDALHATRAAIEEGIVPGGGVALLRIYQHLLQTPTINEDEQQGVNLVCQAILAPIRQILLNAGESPDVIINELNKQGGDYGYNVLNNSYENFLSTGVIDPTKVARVALENSISIIGTMLMSNCVIAFKPELNKEKE